MKSKPILVALGYLFAGTLATSALDAQTTPRIQFEKYTLPNGLEVILSVYGTRPLFFYHELAFSPASSRPR